MIMCTLLSVVYELFKPCRFTHVTGTCFKETALFFNVHLSCFVDFILCPTDKYMFKVKNKKNRLICMYSSLKTNTACHHSFVFVVEFDHSQHINIVYLILTLNKYLSVGCERQVMFWKSCFKVNLPLTDETLCLRFWRHKQEKWHFQFSKLSVGNYISL